MSDGEPLITKPPHGKLLPSLKAPMETSSEQYLPVTAPVHKVKIDNGSKWGGGGVRVNTLG